MNKCLFCDDVFEGEIKTSKWSKSYVLCRNGHFMTFEGGKMVETNHIFDGKVSNIPGHVNQVGGYSTNELHEMDRFDREDILNPNYFLY